MDSVSPRAVRAHQHPKLRPSLPVRRSVVYPQENCDICLRETTRLFLESTVPCELRGRVPVDSSIHCSSFRQHSGVTGQQEHRALG